MINVLHPFTGATGDGAYPHGNLVADSSGNIYGTTAKGGSSDLGSVFKRDASGTLTLLHAFAGGSSDGATPYGSLLLGSDGNFYGMTFAGGASNLGTVFKITPAGVMTLLHSFAGGTGDGSSPRGSLIEGSDGNFYGMTYSGGASGLGSAFKITPAGALTLLHSFAGSTTDGAYPYGSLILGSDGNLYGTTSAGGASSKGTVFKLTPSGTESVMYSFAGGTADGSSPQGDLIQVGDYFYGVTLYGGSVNQGIVFRINPDNSETVLHAFDNSVDDAAVPIGGLILGNDGNLYGLSSRGGNFNLGAIFKIGLDGTETVLYSFAGGIGDGAYPNGNLLLGSDGNFYGMTNAGGSSNRHKSSLLNQRAIADRSVMTTALSHRSPAKRNGDSKTR